MHPEVVIPILSLLLMGGSLLCMCFGEDLSWWKRMDFALWNRDRDRYREQSKLDEARQDRQRREWIQQHHRDLKRY